jgi:hypothetical protein
MKTTAAATTLSLLTALIFTLSFALACGDDDGGSATGSNGDGDDLAGYFADVEQIFDDADAAASEAEEPLNETSSEAELDVKLSALDTYLGEIDTIFGAAIDELDDLDAPSAAAEHHEDFIDGVSVSVAAGEALQDDLANITTDEELVDRLAKFDSDIDAAVEKSDAACLGLQEVADAEDIAVDLAC